MTQDKAYQRGQHRIMAQDTVRTITTHYIDGPFAESHGREVVDLIRPTDRQVIGRAFETYGKSAPADRSGVGAFEAFRRHSPPDAPSSSSPAR